MVDTKKLNIYQKLIEVRKPIGKLTKNEQGYGYKYVPGSQVLGAIQEEMDKQGIILESHLLDGETIPGGKGFVVKANMKMVWINADNPADRSEVGWYMVGEQKDASQAFGSGLTYTERYFIMKYFNLPTDGDDPDGLPKGNGNSKSTPKPKQGNPEGDLKTPTEWSKEKPLTQTQIKKLFVQYHGGDKQAAKEDYDLWVDMPEPTKSETLDNIKDKVKEKAA